MKTSSKILGLALVASLFVTGCCKMDPLTEKNAGCNESSQSVEVKAIMLGDENDSSGITDPDHDEEHDKDELKGE